MDEARTREHVTQHAAAVERGDMDAVVANLGGSTSAQVPRIAQALPQPVTTAEVLNVEIGDAKCVALIRYARDSDEVTIGSRWQEQAGRPVIVAAEPAG